MFAVEFSRNTIKVLHTAVVQKKVAAIRMRLRFCLFSQQACVGYSSKFTRVSE